ncbi:MAG: hypothetical protein HY537_08720 [Deltaproteobacteria bacterium]|nr:hypothetical protein [Deltaproteobacteria bacterium]
MRTFAILLILFLVNLKVGFSADQVTADQVSSQKAEARKDPNYAIMVLDGSVAGASDYLRIKHFLEYESGYSYHVIGADRFFGMWDGTDQLDAWISDAAVKVGNTGTLAIVFIGHANSVLLPTLPTDFGPVARKIKAVRKDAKLPILDELLVFIEGCYSGGHANPNSSNNIARSYNDPPLAKKILVIASCDSGQQSNVGPFSGCLHKSWRELMQSRPIVSTFHDLLGSIRRGTYERCMQNVTADYYPDNFAEASLFAKVDKVSDDDGDKVPNWLDRCPNSIPNPQNGLFTGSEYAVFTDGDYIGCNQGQVIYTRGAYQLEHVYTKVIPIKTDDQYVLRVFDKRVPTLVLFAKRSELNDALTKTLEATATAGHGWFKVLSVEEENLPQIAAQFRTLRNIDPKAEGPLAAVVASGGIQAMERAQPDTQWLLSFINPYLHEESALKVRPSEGSSSGGPSYGRRRFR